MSWDLGSVLLVEDNPGDARLIREMLDELDGTGLRLRQVDRLSSGLDYLAKEEFGVVLLDLSLPDSLGIDTFTRVFAQAPQVPIIVLTGTDDEVLALTAVKTGAQDYLIKGQVDSGLLVRAMRYAMERKQAERALRESEERYALAAAGANDGLWDWNLKGNRIYFSPRWRQMLGYSECDIGAFPEEWFDRVHRDDLDQLRRDLDQHLQGMSPHFRSEYRIRHRDGSYRWMLCRGLAVRDETAVAYRMAGSQTDVHDRKLAEEQLLHDALHDVLTGLPNRVLLTERLERALERARRHPESLFAVLFIDLDRFKNVNDSLGHVAGDRLLVGCGQRLESTQRPGDTVARLGGDEFVVLLEDISGLPDAIRVAERIQVGFAEPFVIDKQELFMAVSIGIALGTAAYDRPENLLRDADTAMYRAKAQGKACYSVFDATMHAQALSFLQIETRLRQAIERQALQIHYQPVVDLQSGTLAGFEALLRWQHPELGPIPPSEFIPVAEEAGLMVQLGEWVLRESCRQMRAWQRKLRGSSGLTISVNVSGKQFTQKTLVESIQAILEDTGLPGRSLRVEITESVLMENAETAANRLQQLRALGIRISMDDFGTGYSSLSYLLRLPVDTLKVDQSFVRSLGNSGESIEIVRTILRLASSLNMDAVVEGVETASQLDILKTMGCRYAQGDYYSAPLPRQGAAALIRKRPHW